MKLFFTKMHGLGNDFVVLDGIRQKPSLSKKIIQHLCHRRFGIGADQLLLLKKSRKADFAMEVYNADGGQVEMCGNGIRCLVQYARDHRLTSKNRLSIETPAGIQTIEFHSSSRITVDMGRPILKGHEIPVKLNGRIVNRRVRFDGYEFRITCVGIGNPHCVIFVDDLDRFQVEKFGPLVEKNHLFPKRTNVEFVKILSPERIQTRVWERGAGETLACGSGACAVAVASALNHRTERNVEIVLKGGTLQIEWRRKDDRLYMTGPAKAVYQGEIEV